MNLVDVPDEMRRLSTLLDESLEQMRLQGREFAVAENLYRKAKREAFHRAPAGTIPEKEAWVNGETADLRLRRDMANEMRTSALEEVRSRRGQISALQTMINADREEAAFARTGPGMAA